MLSFLLLQDEDAIGVVTVAVAVIIRCVVAVNVAASMVA